VQVGTGPPGDVRVSHVTWLGRRTAGWGPTGAKHLPQSFQQLRCALCQLAGTLRMPARQLCSSLQYRVVWHEHDRLSRWTAAVQEMANAWTRPRACGLTCSRIAVAGAHIAAAQRAKLLPQAGLSSVLVQQRSSCPTHMYHENHSTAWHTQAGPQAPAASAQHNTCALQRVSTQHTPAPTCSVI
jgi:hypothetical protein